MLGSKLRTGRCGCEQVTQARPKTPALPTAIQTQPPRLTRARCTSAHSALQASSIRSASSEVSALPSAASVSPAPREGWGGPGAHVKGSGDYAEIGVRMNKSHAADPQTGRRAAAAHAAPCAGPLPFPVSAPSSSRRGTCWWARCSMSSRSAASLGRPCPAAWEAMFAHSTPPAPSSLLCGGAWNVGVMGRFDVACSGVAAEKCHFSQAEQVAAQN